MRIVRDMVGTFIPSDFDITSLAANDYIPLYATQKYYYKGSDVCYYNKPSFENCTRKPNTLKNIKDGFEIAHSTRRIEINGRVFFITKGVFFSETKEPLMVCTMKKNAFLNPATARFSDTASVANPFSYNNYVLFYSTSFFTDPGLTPLNRRLQKEILQSCYEKGIEVRILPSLEIEKNTFARLFEVKKTKSLTQLEAYMNQVLPNFLHNEGEDTFVEQEFEPVVIHREELSVQEEAMLFDIEVENTTENLYVTYNVNGSIAELSAQALELAELAAEAAQFDSDLEPSDEEEYTDEEYNEDWENDEHDEDAVEEMLREEESAHTGSERNVTVYMNQQAIEQFQEALRAEANSQLSGYSTIAIPEPQAAQSFIERMRPLQDASNRQMLQAQQSAQLQAEREHVRSWQSVIQLVDDTE